MSDSTPVNETTRCDPSNGKPVEGANRLPSSDPVVGTLMTVPIDQIQPYDRNPRQQPNRAYELIKASIETRGFRGVLPITRRPGETHYRVAEGGNTTLTILKALHRAGDPRFDTVPCRFEPWVSESETLIAHLVENDARDDLLFIDKAEAVRAARHLLEAELGTALSQRALANALTERGYRLDHSAIARMDYALDRATAALLLPM
jgi:ParB family protein of integrating conjugative element (PFGI_1 class)